MTERNTELQPHEYPPAKMERIITTVKNLSAEKIDLVRQHLKVPMQANRDASMYYLRFWRLAEGMSSVQEVPMDEAELQRLGKGILLHCVPELTKKKDAKQDEQEYAREDEDEEDETAPELVASIRSDIDGGYTGFMRYKGHSLDTESHKSVVDVLAVLIRYVNAQEEKVDISAGADICGGAAEAPLDPDDEPDTAEALESEESQASQEENHAAEKSE
jgi:hypothetical protein